MLPITQFDKERASKIRFLLADIDDTVTHEGMLPSGSLLAMERLQETGIKVIPVTGRPAGWCDHIARMWPVDAVVGENGALYMSYNRMDKRMILGFAKEAQERQRDRERLNQLAQDILSAIPGAGIASDQPYRIADLAVDFCEDVEPLDAAQIELIVSMFKAAGATAKVSSIHVNGWFGAYDKLSMTKRLFSERFGIDIEKDRENCAYVGDSPNDQPMFAYFSHSIGVANVRDFKLDHPPTFVTQDRSASGFQELAQLIIASR